MSAGNAVADPITTTLADRLIGRVRGAAPGPMVISVAAIHGNEPAGIGASRRVVEALAPLAGSVRGDLVVFRGNLRAMAAGKRFIARDLNRQWTTEKIARLRDEERSGRRGGWSPEDHEQAELIAAIESEARGARGPLVFIDLHTTSADGIPFAMIGDNLANRELAMQLPIAVILGLEELVDGPLLEYMCNQGYVTLGIEGGQHDNPGSVENIENALWLALAGAGLIAPAAVPGFEARRAALAATRPGLPHVMEVLHRHAITPEDAFRMMPGFANIQRVRAGDLLAHDRDGEIRARRDAVIFLPLYQAQGDDGFFLGREVPASWLRISSALRGIHLGPVMRLMPGVTRDPADRSRLIVSSRFIRWYPLELLSLFGFRKIRHQEGHWFVSRRRQG